MSYHPQKLVKFRSATIKLGEVVDDALDLNNREGDPIPVSIVSQDSGMNLSVSSNAISLPSGRFLLEAGCTSCLVKGQQENPQYITIGKEYYIHTVGTSNFTTMGSPNNNLGTVFTPSSLHSGSSSGKLVLNTRYFDEAPANPHSWQYDHNISYGWYKDGSAIGCQAITGAEDFGGTGSHFLIEQNSREAHAVVQGPCSVELRIIAVTYEQEGSHQISLNYDRTNFNRSSEDSALDLESENYKNDPFCTITEFI